MHATARSAAVVALLAASCVAIHSRVVLSAVPVAKGMKSFGNAIKGGHLLANTETTLFEHAPGVPGVVTEQWFTGGGCMDENANIKIYIDGEATASLDFMVLLAHGIGVPEKDEATNLPWGVDGLMGHEADGGIYNTFRIPFGKSIKITVTHPTACVFWYIIRGVENYPLIIGDLLLPATTRLRLYKNEAVTVQKLDYITLVNTSAPASALARSDTSTAGMLFMVTLFAESQDFTYLEACVRAYVDGATEPMFLSSGTEDFFLSAYYFNKGNFHDANSGLSAKFGPGTVSAYKFFERDPILFTDSLALHWRCGEDSACPNVYPPPPPGRDAVLATARRDHDQPNMVNMTTTTYSWVYEYSLNE